MPTALYDLILDEYAKLGTVTDSLTHVATRMGMAGDQLVLGNMAAAGNELLTAETWLNYTIEDLTSGTDSYRYAEYRVDAWINSMVPWDADPYDLTMADILATMLTATPYEIMYYIGLLDAYRQSGWNKEFNEEFFAALARGFE